jgi:hypothetical protein
MPPTQLDLQFFRPRSERETRIPGLARKRAPQARGLLGGNEAKAGHRWGRKAAFIRERRDRQLSIRRIFAAPHSGW